MHAKPLLAVLALASLPACNLLGTDVAGRMAKVLGTTPVAVCQARFEKGDADKSGGLSQDEYVKTLPTPRPPNEDTGLLFRGMDTDKDGRLSPEEYATSACKPTGNVAK